jgi:hypothetical protein
MEVDISSGTFYLGEQEVDFGGGSVTLETGDSDPRKDLITVDTNGSLTVNKGTPAATRPSGEVRAATWQPSPVDVTGYSGLPIAEVWVAADATAIQSADIRDRRVSREMLSNTWVQALQNFNHGDAFADYPISLGNDTDADADGSDIEDTAGPGTLYDASQSLLLNAVIEGLANFDAGEQFSQYPIQDEDIVSGNGSGLDADTWRQLTPGESGATIAEDYRDGLDNFDEVDGVFSIDTTRAYYGSQCLQINTVSEGNTYRAFSATPSSYRITPEAGTIFAASRMLDHVDDRHRSLFGVQDNTTYYMYSYYADSNEFRLHQRDADGYNTIASLDVNGYVDPSDWVGKWATDVIKWEEDGTITWWPINPEGQVVGELQAQDTTHTDGGLGVEVQNQTVDSNAAWDMVRVVPIETRGAETIPQAPNNLRVPTKDAIPASLEPGQSVWVEDEERYYYEDGN